MSDLLDRLRLAPVMPPPYEFVDRENLTDLFDIGMRHRSGVVPADRLRAWLGIFRQFAYATRDDGWGELEKEVAIVLCNYVRMIALCREAADALSPPAPSPDDVYRACRVVRGCATDEQFRQLLDNVAAIAAGRKP